jgi:hypothetical protein
MLLGVWLLYLSFGLNIAALAPLVPVIESDLGMSHSAMGRVLGAWQFVFILSAIPCGILLDRLGPRWAMLGGALLMAVSAFWRSIANDENTHSKQQADFIIRNATPECGYRHQQCTAQHRPARTKPIKQNPTRYRRKNKNELPGPEHPTHCRMTHPEIGLDHWNQRC